MKYIKKYEYFFSGKKNKHLEQQKKNEDIIKLIYDKGLQYHEGEFKPKTWFRYGNLTSEKQNDKLITDFAGISLVYDLVNKEYNLYLATKFKEDFKYEILNDIKNTYDFIDLFHHSSDFGITFKITFKEK